MYDLCFGRSFPTSKSEKYSLANQPTSFVNCHLCDLAPRHKAACCSLAWWWPLGENLLPTFLQSMAPDRFLLRVLFLRFIGIWPLSLASGGSLYFYVILTKLLISAFVAFLRCSLVQSQKPWTIDFYYIAI